MKRLLFVLFLTIGFGANAQTKPIQDTTQKYYRVTFDLPSWTFIDSVFRNGINYIGRTLSVDDADKIKTPMIQILTLFINQINNQLRSNADTTGRKSK